MRAWLILHAATLLGVAAEAREYLLMSLPALRQVAYIALPDPTLRLLITSGLVNPKGLAVDAATNRLFVADPGQLPPKVFWYQLLEIGKGKIMTDGRQHIAADSSETSWVAVDGVGSLYFTGKYIVPPPMVSSVGLFKRDAIAMVSQGVDPTLVYSTGNTGAPAKYSGAGGLATDNLNVYWANGVQGKTHGSLIKAPAAPPDANVEASVIALAANEDQVNGVCITPQLIFYSTPNGVFGVDKAKVGSACDEKTCVSVSTDQLPDPQGLVWDGDGTVYVADASLDGGTVVSFPSGALQAHEMQKLAAAPRVNSVALLQLDPDAVPAKSLACVAAVVAAWI